MGFITYSQSDSRWGRLNYNGSSSMSTAGCGPTSCAMIAYGVDGKTTPLDTMKYMQNNGYAIRNNGTAWNGIPACLKAYGVQDVQNVPTMAKVWELMAKGYVGVFLFRSGSRGGITWTTSGHYIAVTDYKVQDGKHYIYTRDSGGRNHTGWYCYETQMAGLIPQIWLGTVEAKPMKKPLGKYYYTIAHPTLKKGDKGDQVMLLQNFLNWYGCNCGKADKVFGSNTEYALKQFQKTEGITVDGIYGQTSYMKAYAYKGTKPSGTHKMGHCASRKLDCVEQKFTYSSSSSSAYHWTYVAVWKDAKMAEKAAQFAEQCNKRKPIIQYDDKPNLKARLIKNGGKMPSGSLTANCSNYVNACVYYASHKNIYDYGAKNNLKYLKASGLFNIYTDSRVKKYVQRGAIYGGSHHTAISLGLK